MTIKELDPIKKAILQILAFNETVKLVPIYTFIKFTYPKRYKALDKIRNYAIEKAEDQLRAEVESGIKKLLFTSGKAIDHLDRSIQRNPFIEKSKILLPAGSLPKRFSEYRLFNLIDIINNNTTKNKKNESR